ncbi:MAG: hypothetical protein MJ195_01355 [Mycoplasmoidaceae bacterium]|nr:hypothetical protein [Mycoplasmoidaceae bacterium]
MNATGTNSAQPLKNVPMKCPQLCQLIAPIITEAIKNNIAASTIPQLPIGKIVVMNGNTLANVLEISTNPDHPVIFCQSINPTINIKKATPNTINVHLRLLVIGGRASLSNEYFSLNCTSDI